MNETFFYFVLDSFLPEVKSIGDDDSGAGIFQVFRFKVKESAVGADEDIGRGFNDAVGRSQKTQAGPGFRVFF